MDLLRAFLPNAKESGYDPFPAPAEERLAPLSLSPVGAFRGFSKCCRAAMNRTIVGFCDPSLYQCKDEVATYFRAWNGDAAAVAAMESIHRQETDPTTLPWRSKPQYLQYLKEEGRLRVDE